MVLTSQLIKRTDTAWAVGTNEGCLDTGAVGNNIYYFFLIQRPDTGVKDVLCSLSPTAPTMPANYVYFRRVGAVVRTGGSILSFIQTGNRFIYTTPVMDASAVSVGTSRSLITLTAPPSMRSLIRASIYRAGGPTALVLQPTTEADAAPSFSVTPGLSLYAEDANGGAAGSFEIQMNSSSQIAARANFASSILGIATLGWIDNRGQYATP